MQLTFIQRKVMIFAAVAVLMAGVFLYAFTGTAACIAVPFLLLFGVLLAADLKAAYWVLLGSIPLSIQMSFTDTLATSMPDEPMMWLFFGVLIFLLAWRPQLPAAWWRHPLTFIIVVQLLWLVIAVIHSRVALLSLKFLLAKGWFLVCFFLLPQLIFRKKKDFKAAFFLLVIPTIITMIIITIRHGLLGFGFAEVGAGVGRLYLNHVEYSSLVSMLLPVLCVGFPLIKKEYRWQRYLLLALIVFFIVVVFLTYARAALIGVLFAFVLAIAIRRKVAQYVMPAIYGFIALTVTYFVTGERYMALKPDYEHTYMHTNFADHMSATFRGQDLSSMERLYRWVAAIRMSRDEPLAGFGPHGFYHYYQPYALQEFRTYTSDNPEHSTTHNYFLLMLTEQGWPAMLLYALLMMVAFKQAQNIYHRFSDRFYKQITLGLAMLLAVNFVNNFFSELIETHKIGAVFYLALSLLIVLDRKSREESAGGLQ